MSKMPVACLARYVKASCDSVDLAAKKVKCKVPGGTLELPYDELVVSVGCEPNTFGTPGVMEHGLFLKEIEHGQAVQNRVLSCLESAGVCMLCVGLADRCEWSCCRARTLKPERLRTRSGHGAFGRVDG